MTVGRTRLLLVDTPELWDKVGVENVELVKDCLALAVPRPHIFLLVLQVGRFTQGESETLRHLQKIFGQEIAEHAIVLFVHFEENQPRSQRINDWSSVQPAGAPQEVQESILRADITRSDSALGYPQLKGLLSGIHKLVASHGGRSIVVKRFSSQELQERNQIIVERKEGVLEVNHQLKNE